MAFSYVGISNIKNSSGDNECGLTPNASTAVGDIMFAFISTQVGYTTGTPSGWTKLAENVDGGGEYYQLFYKVKTAAGAEPEAAFPYTVTARKIYGYITSWRDGFNTTNPIDVYSNTQYVTSSTEARAATMTVTKTNSPIIFFGSLYYTSSTSWDSHSGPATRTEVIDSGSTTADFWTTVSYVVWTSSGATGTMSANMNQSRTTKHAFAVALNTPVSGPANLKSYNTNLKANIKSINTNLIANVKSLNTNI